MVVAEIPAHIDIADYEVYLNKRTRPNTATTYLTAIREFDLWLAGRPCTREAAQEYLDYLESQGKAPNTVCVKANAIRRWFKWKGNRISLDFPSIQLGAPKYITGAQLDTLINACVTPLEEVLVIGLFDSACRVSEWIGIGLSDIDWDNRMVKVTRKGGKEAWVNISEFGVAALREWLGSRKSKSEKVFMDLTRRDAWETIKKVGERAGIPLYPHMFRHSRAVQMLLAGAEPHIVQQHLGHVSISTTLNIYGQLFPMHLKSKIPRWEHEP